jgi:hypothetical protein
MNIHRVFELWNKPSSSQFTSSTDQSSLKEFAANSEEENSNDALASVVQLAPGSPLDVPAGLCSQTSISSPEPAQPRGLLETPALKAFFAENHFGLGRHNGAQYMTQDAMELGRQTLVARFQNTLELLIAQKQAKVDALRDMAVQTQGVCATVTSQLSLACQRLERDMTAIQSQSVLAAEGKGWVLRALNEYKIGFGKGLREAVNMKLLG